MCDASGNPKYVSGIRGLEILHKSGVLIAKETFYKALAKGDIPSIRIGKRYFVREDVLNQMEASK